MWNFLVFLFNEIFYKPLFNFLFILYKTVAFYDLGIAIIVLTILIRIALYPLTKKMIESQKNIAALQPMIKVIQEKYRNNKEEQNKEILKLYQEKKINPAGGCLPLLIQIPILMALYKVFASFIDSNNLSAIYSFVGRPENLNTYFLGLVDLSKPNIYLALLAGVSQFIQSKIANISNSKQGALNQMAAAMNKQMLYFMPFITILIAMKFAGGLALYWTIFNIVYIIQQLMLNKRN